MTGRESSTIVTKRLRSLLVFIFTINVLSAILFMLTVRRPVYDDDGNMLDARSYAAHGISASTIRAQRDTPGPASFIWMAYAIRLIGHDDLLDARMSVLLSWLLLFVLMTVAVRDSEWAGLWYGALLATLILPHSLTAMATALTEGPAILFALLGAIAWTQSVSRQERRGSTSLALAIVGGLLMGFAVTSRQYYLALFPAAGVLALMMLRGRPGEQIKPYLGRIVFSLMLALLPVLVMVFLWKGITSPGMATGTSYSNYQAGIGLNLIRPVDVTFYIALYLVPFTLPAMWRPSLVRNWRVFLVASLAGLVATHFRITLVNPGPLHSLLEVASRIPLGAGLLFWMIASATAYNFIVVCSLLWTERSTLRACAPAAFAVLVVLFFIAEQVGVGGNIPFYDRYVLQLGPFLGVISFWLFPSFTRSRILTLAGLALLSYGMLWRYAFTLK